ncbi:hypothetical protein DTO96_102209 [Ephemeroptericola cinctiostellae]|uniref:NAD-dependent epimerase/dehydratase domain-containing protein n=1 Tax=Ephemeroptericola cinctiostellae TaxID=2268024 RepID=A0A345DDL7_9BURK|nr:NAD-dependent epimerase/dehydratase family protein [Ephemeroptericola cinctiostellae]AXF86455.1 hypothetical protein DTO96_102209 [Ephemeroptericola cinctiostellae]
MRILLLGASGFIGRHLETALVDTGYAVVRASRNAQGQGDVQVDYVHDTAAAVWLPRLKGIDVVVNAVGVLRDTVKTPMQAIHADAPKALFEACVQSNVQRVIQISALGAGGRDDLAYMRTKGEADAHLLSLPLNGCIFRPSVVYGHDGESATTFRRLAALPILVVPGRGEAMLQPVHIDDLCAAVMRAVAGEASHGIVHAVGPQAMTYRDMIACYRAQGHSRAAWVVPMPWVLMGCVAAIAQYVPSSPLEPDTLTMLRAGSVADAAPFERLVGRALRHPNTFLMG